MAVNGEENSQSIVDNLQIKGIIGAARRRDRCDYSSTSHCRCSRDRRQGQQLARSRRGGARAWLMAADNNEAGECCSGVGSLVITVQASQQAVVVVGAVAHGAGRSAAASSSMELE